MKMPDYHYFTFDFNGFQYQIDKVPLGFYKVPSKLVIEETRSEDIKGNAQILIRGNEKNSSGSYKYFSGLQGLSPENWYIGNHYNPRTQQRSLQLFHLTDGNKHLEIYFFNNWYKENRTKRYEFAEGFIYSLTK